MIPLTTAGRRTTSTRHQRYKIPCPRPKDLEDVQKRRHGEEHDEDNVGLYRGLEPVKGPDGVLIVGVAAVHVAGVCYC